MERSDQSKSCESLFRGRGRSRQNAHRRPAAHLAMLWEIWRFAAIEVEIAFDEWCHASQAGSDAAYAIYVDALRREGDAADQLAQGYCSGRTVAA
jgi:hypothetical protein